MSRTIRLAATDTTETLSDNTPALSRARFERLYRAAHGPEVPAEVSTAPLWAGGGADGIASHVALCDELDDDASTLDAVGSEGYVLLAGQGDGCDVWARYTTV
jgi:hypothetical protein